LLQLTVNQRVCVFCMMPEIICLPTHGSKTQLITRLCNHVANVTPCKLQTLQNYLCICAGDLRALVNYQRLMHQGPARYSTLFDFSVSHIITFSTLTRVSHFNHCTCCLLPLPSSAFDNRSTCYTILKAFVVSVQSASAT
jgi:hypothetical protein